VQREKWNRVFPACADATFPGAELRAVAPELTSRNHAVLRVRTLDRGEKRLLRCSRFYLDGDSHSRKSSEHLVNRWDAYALPAEGECLAAVSRKAVPRIIRLQLSNGERSNGASAIGCTIDRWIVNHDAGAIHAGVRRARTYRGPRAARRG
jgi:hypothetical protein